MSSRNTAGSAFGFVGGLMLEMGAAVALLAVLWQPSSATHLPAVDAIHFGSQLPSFANRDVRTALLPEPRRDDFSPRYVADQRTFSQPMQQPYTVQQPVPMLPPAPTSWEQSQPNFQPETRVVTAQPYIRPLRGDQPAVAPQPRVQPAPVHRTADLRGNDFYNRY